MELTTQKKMIEGVKGRSRAIHTKKDYLYQDCFQ